MRRFAAAVGVAFCILVAAAPAAAQPGPFNCGRLSQNLLVRDVLTEYYLWYRQLPRLNPANYASPEAYLEAVRYRPLDRTFSYITDRASNDAFYSASQFIGLGISTQTTATELRILQVFPDSPASEAGLARGDRFVSINGRSVSDLIATGAIGGASGANEEGVRVTAVIRTRGGEERRVEMVKRAVTIPTVSLTSTFDIEGRKVGYLMFRNFVEPSYRALDDAFAALKEAGATELVIDLRYNGGGLVDVAVHLGSLVGGTLTEGQVFAVYRHNDKNDALNRNLRFRAAPQSLNLSRLFVITTNASASASELVINSLRAYIPVIVIGDSTYGKPVGQYGFNFCDKVLAPVSFSLVNANGEGDFFDGIAPTCAAPDDVEHDLGAGDEASLAEVFTFIRTGTCSVSSTSFRSLRTREFVQKPVGWQSVVNAH